MQANNISVFLKTFPEKSSKLAILSIAQDSNVEKLLDKTPLKDLITISREYQKTPRLYNEVLSGKIKFFLKGLQDFPLPIFDSTKATNLNDFTLADGFSNNIIWIFRLLLGKEPVAKKIILKNNGNELNTLAFDGYGKVISNGNVPFRADSSSPIARMLKASSDGKINLIRD